MRVRWRSMPLVTVVGLGFLFILILMAVFTVTGITQMSSVNSRMNHLVNRDNVKIALVHEMQNALRERAVTMHILSLMTDPFDQDTEYTRLGALGAKFVKARAALLALPLSDEENKILNRMRDLTVETQPLLVQAVEIAMDGRNDKSQELIREKIAPNQRVILGLVNDLLAVQQRNAQTAVELTGAAHLRARWLMVGLGGGVVLLGLGIAVAVVRLTTHQARLLQHQAMYDGLTGLPNRSLFADRLQQTLLVGRRERQAFALIAMDLDRFKEINDTLGHHVGDEVLKQTARIVRLCLRESDTLARMGGDEFSILLQTAQTAEGAVIAAKRILDKLRDPVTVSGHELEIGASLGIAMFPEHSEQIDDLQRMADSAMYHAKRTHSGYAAYGPELDQKTDDRLELQTALRKALTTDELVLHYQPKIEFSDHRVSGVEALVRWQHPTRGLLAPDMFIPFAEESGLIRPLTAHILQMAVEQAATWFRDGIELSIAVNVSAINIQDTEFADLVGTILEQQRLPPELLELELTESAVMADPARAVVCIKKLHDLGVQISIDDFGTGYTSMSQLKELLVAKIKIDRSFVKDMTMNHSDAVIVRTAVDLGHNLGFKVVAEGVENQATWDHLETLGCDSAQGFHMAKPLPPGAFIEWLHNSPWGTGKT